MNTGIGEAAMAVVVAFMTLNPTDKFAAEDLACAAQNAWFEARSGGPEDWRAITEVVLNRVDHPKFPGTVCDVVWEQRHIRGKLRPQFTWTLDGKSDRVRVTGNCPKAYPALWGRVIETVYEAMVDHEDETGGALYYVMPYVKQKWLEKLVPIGNFGMHVFYVEG